MRFMIHRAYKEPLSKYTSVLSKYDFKREYYKEYIRLDGISVATIEEGSIELNTLDELLTLMKDLNNALVIDTEAPNKISILIYDDYIE